MKENSIGDRMNQNIEFKIKRTSSMYGNKRKPTEKAYKAEDDWYIQLNSLEQLIELSKNEKMKIIIDATGNIETLEIYDDDREV